MLICARARTFALNLLAFKPPTYRIHKREGQVEARLLASNLLAIEGPGNNCRYEMCGIVRAYRRPSSPVGFSEIVGWNWTDSFLSARLKKLRTCLKPSEYLPSTKSSKHASTARTIASDNGLAMPNPEVMICREGPKLNSSRPCSRSPSLRY